MKPLGSSAAPLGWVFGSVARLRRRAYETGLRRSYRPPVPVISVGNLSAGGTGKTPTVLWLAERLISAGRTPAILSRGYGGSAGTGPVPVTGAMGASADQVGDEPAMLARLLPEVPLVVGSNRVAGARLACQMGAGCLLLDDGLQHLKLQRDLEVICLDARCPPWRNQWLPAGTLREGPEVLSRAQVALVTRADRCEEPEELLRRLGRLAPDALILRSRHAPGPILDPQGCSVDPGGSPVLAFAGIASPGDLRTTLEESGITLSELRAFPDHHVYLPEELAHLADRAREVGGGVITTEKDAARIGNRWPGPVPLWTAGIRLDMMDPVEPLLELLEGLFQE